MSITMRAAQDADMPAIAAIYEHHVTTDTASFELEAPGAAEMRLRFRENLARGYPYLVAEDSGSGRVAGYAYASAYRARPAYRYTVEDSVYVDAAHLRRGIGSMLLRALIARCEALGYRQMVAIIGGSQHVASIALHASLGFENAGVLRDVGWKFEHWLDTVLMQRALGQGSASPPERIGR